MKYRRAEMNDIERLVELRKKQLIDEGAEPKDIQEELVNFFTVKMKDGSLIEWVAEDKGEIIATGAIVIYEFPPSFTNKSGKKAYVTNMYTKDEYRKQGIATQMLNCLVSEARDRGITKMWLGASELGQPVYERFGFVQNTALFDYTIQ